MTAKAGKRFLSLALALAMILSLGAVPVQAEVSEDDVCQVGEEGFETIAEAVAHINDECNGEGTITLLTDVEEEVTIENGTITIDLNGKTWACDDSSTEYVLYISEGADVTLENGTLGDGENKYGVRIYASGEEENPSMLTVAEDAVIDVDENGIDIYGTPDDNSDGTGLKVEIDGTVKIENTWGKAVVVRTEITTGSPDVVINGTLIGGAGKASTSIGAGLGLYGDADVVVNEGASISGATGIEIRGGSLTVNGGTIESTVNTFDEAEKSGGITIEGAGIAIDESSNDLNITVTITGGIISGYYAIAEDNTKNNENHVTVTITGGTFTSNDDNVNVYLRSEEGVTVEIYCGAFSNVESVADYLADGAIIYDDSHVHTMDEGVVTDPTCGDDGYTTYTCPYCGESFTADPTDATGHHTYGDWAVTKKATSTTDGEMQCVCEVCGDTVTVTIPAGSSEKEVEEITKTVTETVEVPVEKIVTKTETKTVTKTVTEEKEVEVPGETVVVTKEVKVTESGEEIPTTKSHILRVTGTAKSTSVTLKWNKIENADGYVIYGAPCGKVMKKLKTIKSGSTLTWKNTKLKKGTSYKYVVKAYKTVGSSKVVLKSGNEVHVATTNGKFTNVKKVKLDSSIKNITLKAGKTKTISAKKVSVSLNNSRKSLKKCANFIKFRSNNTKIAKVTKAGKITAKKAGSCLIYVYAGDGQYAKIHLTVK